MRSFDRRLNPSDSGPGVETGDIKSSIRTADHNKWILLNGDTLGSASSGATNASEIYRALYILFWDSMADGQAPVSTGRGASGTADFDANKTLTMPDGRGRTLRGTGTGAGLTARTHGDTSGVEDTVVATHGHADTLSTDSDGAHSHFLVTTDNGPSTWNNTSTNIISNSGTSFFGDPDSGAEETGDRPTTDSDGAHTHTMSGSVTDAGVSPTDENASPWLAVNWFIRY